MGDPGLVEGGSSLEANIGSRERWEGGAPGLSVSEPGNRAPPLPRGERVAGIARVGGKGWKLGGAMDFCPLCSFLSKKKEKKCSL